MNTLLVYSNGRHKPEVYLFLRTDLSRFDGVYVGSYTTEEQSKLQNEAHQFMSLKMKPEFKFKGMTEPVQIDKVVKCGYV